MAQLIQTPFPPVVADKRFELRLSSRLMEGLGLMSQTEGIPKADVVRRALGLYARALQEEGEERLIGFATLDSNGSPCVKELVRLNAPPSSHMASSQGGGNSEGFDPFELRVSQSLLEGIDKMANAEGIHRSDVVRRALGLYARALEEEAKERVLVFANLNEGNGVEVSEMLKLR